MIFVTVGTQLPFERLLENMDKWAGDHPDRAVLAQIGQTQYKPKHIKTVISVTPDEYERYLSEAEVIVGHVGMGTIISGIKHSKPLILMPRHANKGEHRNDHQLSTARQFGKLSLVSIVDSPDELDFALETILSENFKVTGDVMEVSPSLIEKISDFIAKGQGGYGN